MDTNEYIRARVASAGSYLASSVRTLAVPINNGMDLEPIGTCVLVWYRGNRFILTAAHVLELYPGHAVYLGTNTAWIEIEGPFRITVPPVGGREEDPFDLAFKLVSSDLASRLDGCHFLTADQYLIRDEVVYDPPFRNKYLALGFPLNRFDMNYRARISQPKSLAFTGAIAPLTDFRRLKLNPLTHILLEGDLDKVIGESGLQTAPKMVGISGGGMFRMPSVERLGLVDPPLLSGITIEQRSRDRLIVGVRLGVVFRAIDEDPTDHAT